MIKSNNTTIIKTALSVCETLTTRRQQQLKKVENKKRDCTQHIMSASSRHAGTEQTAVVISHQSSIISQYRVIGTIYGDIDIIVSG